MAGVVRILAFVWRVAGEKKNIYFFSRLFFYLVFSSRFYSLHLLLIVLFVSILFVGLSLILLVFLLLFIHCVCFSFILSDLFILFFSGFILTLFC